MVDDNPNDSERMYENFYRSNESLATSQEMKQQIQMIEKEAEEEQEEEMRKVQFNQTDDPDFNFAEFAQKRASDRA